MAVNAEVKPDQAGEGSHRTPRWTGVTHEVERACDVYVRGRPTRQAVKGRRGWVRRASRLRRSEGFS